MGVDFLLIQALGLWCLLPLMAAGWLGTEWGTRRSPLAAGALLGLTAGVGAWLGSGLGPASLPSPLLGMVAGIRGAPPEVLGRELPPALAGMVTTLGQAQGRPLAPAEVEREARRLLGLLLETRALPEPLLPARLPGIFQRMVLEGERPGLLFGLVWTPQPDPALGLALAAGLQGGAAGGLVGAGLAALLRRLTTGAEPGWLLPTLLAGLLGAALGSRLGRPPSPAVGFVLGAAAGLAQLAAVVVRGPPGYLRPEVLAGGAVVALGCGVSLALFSGALRGHRAELARAEAARAESESRLALLTAQVRPHFLFNALGTIASSCSEDPARARHLIDCLARFLRRSLRPGTGPVPLADELADLEPYLDLMRARFPDRLTLRTAVEPASRAFPMPALVLQPLVENAIHHGMPEDGRMLTVEVGAAREGAELVVRVRDDGRGASPARLTELDRGDGLGIGLASVRARLAASRPPGRLTLTPRPGGGLEATVRIGAA